MLARLDEMLVVEVVEGRVTGELGRLLEHRDRLLLDCVRVGEVLAQLVLQVVRGDRLQRRLDDAVVAAFEAMHHRSLLAQDSGKNGVSIGCKRISHHRKEIYENR